jgi:hypothetical protein
VTPNHAELAYQMEGTVEPYDVKIANPKLMKEKQL